MQTPFPIQLFPQCLAWQNKEEPYFLSDRPLKENPILHEHQKEKLKTHVHTSKQYLWPYHAYNESQVLLAPNFKWKQRRLSFESQLSPLLTWLCISPRLQWGGKLKSSQKTLQKLYILTCSKRNHTALPCLYQKDQGKCGLPRALQILGSF